MTPIRKLLLVAGFAVLVGACGDSAATTTAVTEPTSTTTVPATTTTAAPTTTLPPTTTAPPTTTVPPTTTAPPTSTTQAGTAADAATAANVQAAVAASSAVTSGRMEGTFEIVGFEGAEGPDSVTFGFAGAFDSTIPATSFVMDLSALAAALGDEIPPGFEDLFSELELRQIGDMAWMRFPFFSQLLGVPTEWISIPAEGASPTEDLIGSTPANPADLLGPFESGGATVLDAGLDPIRGFDTTRYVLVYDVDALVADADPEELASLEELGPLGDEVALDVWIDPDGVLHRFAMVFDSTTSDGELIEDAAFERMTMRFDILDHNQPVEIQPPPPEDVSDGAEFGLVP